MQHTGVHERSDRNFERRGEREYCEDGSCEVGPEFAHAFAWKAAAFVRVRIVQVEGYLTKCRLWVSRVPRAPGRFRGAT